MKKLIIAFLVLIISVSVVFSQNYYSNTGSFNNVTDEDNLRLQASLRILKLQNKKLQEKIIELDNRNSEIELIIEKFKKNIGFLEKENNKLKVEKIVLNNKIIDLNKKINKKINEKRELKHIVKDFYNHIFGDFQKSMKYSPDGEKIFYYIFIYLVYSLFIFIFFFIFTLPLRFLRGIWRLFSGYKPCSNKNIEIEFSKLIKKYRILVEEIKKNDTEKSNLIFEKQDLKNKIKNLKNLNNKLESEIFSLKLSYQENRNSDIVKEINDNKLKKEKINEEESFISRNKINSNFSNNKKIEIKKNILSYKKEKINLFNKKREKFSLKSDKNKKSKLFQ